MSIAIAAIFLLAARHWTVMAGHRLLAGLLYGVPVYAVMTLVIVPLSRATFKPNLSPAGIASDLAAMMLFGIIVAITLDVLSSVRPPDAAFVS